jgi:DNA methylase
VREEILANDLLNAIHSGSPVSGLTHEFYKYPARFSPAFVRAAILRFTRPEDLVLDPFMGGATTLVEASALGRQSLGTDVSSLAVFLARTKTTVMTEADCSLVEQWVEIFVKDSNLKTFLQRSLEDEEKVWEAPSYQKNIRTRSTWAIAKLLKLALADISEFSNARQQRVARCILLKTAQWALDCRKTTPSASAFRDQLIRNTRTILSGARDYADAVNRASVNGGHKKIVPPVCLQRSAVGIEEDPRVSRLPAPSLVLTSPPYPGVHVLYHRWQVNGRRETPAPFWIAGSKDGSGAAYYCFGDRHKAALSSYFETARRAFESVARICTDRTIVVQLIAFSEPAWQLPKYLEIMREAGFVEVPSSDVMRTQEGRVWRTVPNRKWYADYKGSLESSKEVVLFHQLASRR